MTLPNKASYATYGGEKVAYSPAVDPLTDYTAAQLNEALSDAAAMTAMVPRAYVEWVVLAGVVYASALAATLSQQGGPRVRCRVGDVGSEVQLGSQVSPDGRAHKCRRVPDHVARFDC